MIFVENKFPFASTQNIEPELSTSSSPDFMTLGIDDEIVINDFF